MLQREVKRLKSLRKSDIEDALKTVYDPEIPVDIFELGLIYEIKIDDENEVDILMTLTSPSCPVAGELPIMVRDAVNNVANCNGCHVSLTFYPPWDKEKMSEEAKITLGMF